MIEAVPGAIPVTMPVEVPTVAIPVLPLLQVPPVVASESVVVDPWQTFVVPVMDARFSFMTNVVLFHKSPASAAPLRFTSFTTVKMVRLPVPVAGEVHGILMT